MENYLEAVERGDLNTLHGMLLAHPYLLHKFDSNGCNSLHIATWWGHLQVVEYLVDQQNMDPAMPTQVSVHININTKL